MAMFEQDEWDLALLDELLLKAEQETSARKSATASNFPAGPNTGFPPREIQSDQLVQTPTLRLTDASDLRANNHSENARSVGCNKNGISEQSRDRQNQWLGDNVDGMTWPSRNPKKQPRNGPLIAQNQGWREPVHASSAMHGTTANAFYEIPGNGGKGGVPSHVQRRYTAHPAPVSTLYNPSRFGTW